MDKVRAAVLTLLLIWAPVLLAGDAAAVGSFLKELPGTDQTIPVTSATFADKIFFQLKAHVEDGEHSLLVNVYDGKGREVLNAERVVIARGNVAGGAVTYGFDPGRDAPGTWWYVAALDGKVVVSSSIEVSR
ncbi:MAG TPA: hypothetical protein VIT67_05950 [Povalibacter sp.]